MDLKLLIILTLIFALPICIYFIRRYYLRQLRNEVTRAQKSEQIKSVFLANVSHALRTPLNSIIGFSDVILKEKPGVLKEDQLTEMVTHINHNGHQLLYFISQLLELSSFEGSMLTFTMIEVNLAELMASYRREALRDASPNVSIYIRTTLSPHCKATLDTNLMHQLIMHLLQNAVLHTKEGSITMTYERERKGMKVTIIDTGDGVPQKLQENIFSILQHKDSLTLANQTSGLGLSICKAIVDALNGEIGLSSEEGKGTTVWVWIPCHMRDMTKGI